VHDFIEGKMQMHGFMEEKVAMHEFIEEYDKVSRARIV
jgi:hypothetical protein